VGRQINILVIGLTTLEIFLFTIFSSLELQMQLELILNCL